MLCMALRLLPACSPLHFAVFQYSNLVSRVAYAFTPGSPYFLIG